MASNLHMMLKLEKKNNRVANFVEYNTIHLPLPPPLPLSNHPSTRWVNCQFIDTRNMVLGSRVTLPTQATVCKLYLKLSKEKRKGERISKYNTKLKDNAKGNVFQTATWNAKDQ